MADVQIPREAVEAAARALYVEANSWRAVEVPAWGDVDPQVKHTYRERAMAALNAAAPLIVAAAFDRVAHDVDTTKTSDDGDYMTAFKAGQRWFKTILREHAELLRAQT